MSEGMNERIGEGKTIAGELVCVDYSCGLELLMPLGHSS